MPVEFTFEDAQCDPAKRGQLLAFIRRHGSHSMAYSVLQPGMKYFVDPEVGFVAFMSPPSSPGTVWVLGNPMTEIGGRATEFLREFFVAHPRARFVQVTAAHAQWLHYAFGYFATPIGIETRLDLVKFTWAGRKREKIRTSIRRASERATVREMASPTDSDLESIEQVSLAWMQGRKGTDREIIFMDRPLLDLRDPMLRRFGAFSGGAMLRSMICTPVFEHGEVPGFLVDITRCLPGSHAGTGDLLLHAAVETFRTEHRRFVDLGISPCHQLCDDPLKLHDPLTRAALALLFKCGNRIFNFRGIARRKRLFGGDEFHVYALHRERCALPAISKLLRLCRVI